MSLTGDERQWLTDMIRATVQAAQRNYPIPEQRTGTVLAFSPAWAIRSIPVSMDAPGNPVVFADNLTGEPLIVNDRVMVLTDSAGAFITGRWGASRIPHTRAFRASPLGTGSASSTAYTNFPTLGAMNFTKYFKSTKIRFDVAIGGVYATGAFGDGLWAVQFNGLDYECALNSFSQLSVRASTSGFTEAAAGIDPGNYTAQLRWCIAAASGTTLNVDGESSASFSVTEISP